MFKRLFLLLAALAVVAPACGGPSVTVNYDYDTDYDFSHLKKYAYLPIKSVGSVSELRIRRFVDAVNNQLKSQGYILTTDNPDFLVALHTASKEKTEITDWGYGMSPRARWYGGYHDIDVSQYTEGTVFVDIVDPVNRNLVWRGTATSEVDDSMSPDEQSERFAQIAARIFAKFPPKK